MMSYNSIPNQKYCLKGVSQDRVELTHIVSLTLSPTYLRCELIFDLDDYEKKGGITA